jgi:hypothetical protein
MKEVVYSKQSAFLILGTPSVKKLGFYIEGEKFRNIGLYMVSREWSERVIRLAA